MTARVKRSCMAVAAAASMLLLLVGNGGSGPSFATAIKQAPQHLQQQHQQHQRSLLLRAACSPQDTVAGASDVPPVGFNYQAATPAQLACYGLPPRPSAQGSQDQAFWDRMTSGRWIIPTATAPTGGQPPLPFRPAPPRGSARVQPRVSDVPGVTQTIVTSQNWAGYAVTEHDNGGQLFDRVGAISPVQSCLASTNLDGIGYTVYWWVGLGGIESGSNLYQGGVGCSILSTHKQQTWLFVEDVCASGTTGCANGGAPIQLSLPSTETISATDLLYAYASLASDSFYFSDLTKGWQLNYFLPNTTYTAINATGASKSADIIAEDWTCPGGVCASMSYQGVIVSEAQVWPHSGTATNIAAYNFQQDIQEWAVIYSAIVAQPSPLQSWGTYSAWGLSGVEADLNGGF